MRVVIAGGHGQIAIELERMLVGRGDEAVGLLRNPAHADELEAGGAEAVVLDLESSTVEELAARLDGADAVVFAAGAGPGSGIERKRTVDRDAAVLLADAATVAGVSRYVMVSAISADDSEAASDEVYKGYLEAKAAADAHLRGSGLDWTIVRPGGLTNDAPTGSVHAAEKVERDSIPRADVAAVLLAALDDPHTVGKQFELVTGGTPVARALSEL